MTMSSDSCSDSLLDPFWHYFLSSALALEVLILIFRFFFLCLLYLKPALSDTDDGSELAHSSLSLHKKMKFSIKDFFSKCDQIRRKLRIWSHLLNKSLIENFIFCAVYVFDLS